MIAVATSVVVLVGAVIVLFGAMAAMSVGLPTITVTRRRRMVTFEPRGTSSSTAGAVSSAAPRPIPQAIPIDVRSHRVVTGRPARLPGEPTSAAAPIPLGPSQPTPRVPRTDELDPGQRRELREAIDLVERLIEHQPERLAELITIWINDDSS